MNAILKIFKNMTTKMSSISPPNLSKIIEFTNMIKFGDFFTENGQKGDFYSKNVFLTLPT